jgi:hypothetical protein
MELGIGHSRNHISATGYEDGNVAQGGGCYL